MAFRTLLILSLLCFCSACSSKVQTLPPGSNAPQVRMTKLDGTPILLDEYRGRKVVLFFWATTCTYSRSVIERLNDFAEYQKAKKRNPAVVLAVSIDKLKDFENLKERIEGQKLSAIEHFFSGNDAFDEAYMAFQVDRLPYLVVLDERGKILAAAHDDSMIDQIFSPSK